MKLRIALVGLVALVLGSTAAAQPVPSPGLQRVAHSSELTGSGTTSSPLGLKTTCSSGQVLAFVGSVWTCTTVASSITVTSPITGTGSSGSPLAWSPTLTAPLAGTGSSGSPLNYVPNVTSPLAGTGSAGSALAWTPTLGNLQGTGSAGNVLRTNLTTTTCSAGNHITAIAADGTGTCGANTVSVTSPIGGTGSSGSPITWSPTLGNLQGTGSAGSALRTNLTVTTCSTGQGLTAIAADGTGTCGADVLSMAGSANGGLACTTTAGAATCGLITSCSTGQVLAWSGSAWACASAGSVTTWAFGNGIDGSVTYDGTTTILGMAPSSSVYTLTRDIYLTTGTVNTGVTIITHGYRIFASTSLTLNGTAVIHNDGGGGGSGVTPCLGTGGTAGAAAGVGTFTGGAGGGSGGGSATAGSVGGNGSGEQGFTGTGGAGGTGNITAGGAGGTLTTKEGWGLHDLLVEEREDGTPFSGAGGGGGGTCGGGGGGAGGIVWIATPLINGTGGTLRSKGGAGGNATPATNAGGGGGGGGGRITLMTSAANTPAYTTTVTGGAAGTHTGTGVDGTAGGSGKVDLVDPGTPGTGGGGGGGAGTITGVTAGTSLTGGGTFGAVTLNVALPGGTCLAGQDVTAIAADGTATCSNQPFNAYGGKHFEWIDEFMYSSITAAGNVGPWAFSIVAASSAATQIAGSTRPGLYQLATGTTTTASAALSGGAAAVDFGNGSWTYEVTVGLPSLSVSANEFSTFYGFGDVPGSPNQVDGCYFLYDRGNVATPPTTGAGNTGNADKFACLCAANSATSEYLMDGSTVSDESFTTVSFPVVAYVVPDTNIHTMRITMTGTTRAEFFVDGTKTCDINTHIPSGTSRVTGVIAGAILKSSGTNIRMADIDRVRYSVDLTSARTP